MIDKLNVAKSPFHVNFKAENRHNRGTVTSSPDIDTFNKMVEMQKLAKKEEKRRKFSMGATFLMTSAFLAMAGITIYQFIKGKGSGSKTVFRKLGDDIPNYTDDCVNQQIKALIEKKKKLLSLPKESLEHFNVGKKAKMIVIYGPPGTGKTLSCQICAKAIGAEYAEVQFSELSSAFVGETSVHITKKCEEFYKIANRNPNKQYVITFNEIDSLLNNVEKLGSNNEHLGQNRTALLNGLDLLKKCPNVTIFGTTNINPKSAKLDPAALSRLKILNLGMPSAKELTAAFEYHLKKIPAAAALAGNKEALTEIANIVHDKNGVQRDVENIVDEALETLICRTKDTNASMQKSDIMDAINNHDTWASSISEDVAGTGNNETFDLGKIIQYILQTFKNNESNIAA